MVQVMLSGSERESERIDRWSVMLAERGLVVVPHVFDLHDRATREQQDAFARQTAQDVRRSDVLWVLYPEHPSCGATYALGFARALREEGSSRVRIVVTSRARAPWAERPLGAASVQADYRGDSDALGFHDICNAATRIIMSRALARAAGASAAREHGR